MPHVPGSRFQFTLVPPTPGQPARATITEADNGIPRLENLTAGDMVELKTVLYFAEREAWLLDSRDATARAEASARDASLRPGSPKKTKGTRRGRGSRL